jgi:predicted dehydrogenase
VVRALAEEAIGAVRTVELRIGRPDCARGNAGWRPDWRTDLTYAGGGIILDHGWHQLYLLLGWMRAPVEAVSAVTRTTNQRHYPVEDEALIDMLFPSAHGRIELSWVANGRTNGGMIRGSRGTITIHDDRLVIENSAGERELSFLGRLSESSYHPEWFRATFRANVLDERRDEADRNFAEAGVLVSAIQACYRSAQESGLPCRPTFSTHEAIRSAVAQGTDVMYVSSSSGGCPP